MNNNHPRLLAACVVAALGVHSGAQAAVTLNPRGEGQVLLYPYYTVNGGNDTYLSVTNTTAQSKALKVRFRESRNARPVLEFNVYVGAYDVWTAAAFALDGNGPANLLTQDTSCTVPAIGTNTSLPQLANGTRYLPFRNFAYSDASRDNGPSQLSRTREGYIEVIDMGTLRVGSGLTQVAEEVAHGSLPGGLPVGCPQVVNNWITTQGAWGDLSTGNRMKDIERPTGGLYGTAQIINVANGMLHAYVADAIDGFYGGSAPEGGLHYAPGAGHPTLADASDGGPTVSSLVTLDDGRSVASTWAQGTADAISAVLMRNEIHNEFEFTPAIGAASEWVLTFPTKSFYADTGGTPRAPFTDAYADDGQSCEPTTSTAFGRDQETTDNICNLTPPGLVHCGAKPNVCNAVSNVVPLRVGSPEVVASPIFGSGAVDNGSGSATPWSLSNTTHGIGAIAFPQGLPNGGHALVSLNGDRYVGLPVIGFWSVNYMNSNAQPGKLGNYSGAMSHRGTTFVLQQQ